MSSDGLDWTDNNTLGVVVAAAVVVVAAAVVVVGDGASRAC